MGLLQRGAPGVVRRARSAGGLLREIAPGAERRRVPLGGDLNFVKRPRCAFGAPLGFYGPLAHLNEFDRRGHKKPAPREGRGRLTQLGGERGIRTPGTVTRTRAFQARSFSHSDTSPGVQLSRGGFNCWAAKITRARPHHAHKRRVMFSKQTPSKTQK